MKLGIVGCLTASAAALLLGGCAEDEYATRGDVYRGGYAGTTIYENEPRFVEERTVFLDRQPRNVAIYRTGGTYFYDYGGRRYTLTDYTSIPRSTVIERPGHVSTARYSRYIRGHERALVRTGYTEDERTAFRRENTFVTRPSVSY